MRCAIMCLQCLKKQVVADAHRFKRPVITWRQTVRVQELCESRGGLPGLPVLMSLMVSVDVKQHSSSSGSRRSGKKPDERKVDTTAECERPYRFSENHTRTQNAFIKKAREQLEAVPDFPDTGVSGTRGTTLQHMLEPNV